MSFRIVRRATSMFSQPTKGSYVGTAMARKRELKIKATQMTKKERQQQRDQPALWDSLCFA